VHRPDGAGRARRPHRPWPAAGRPAGGPRRSRAPRAADPRRLRRQEPPHQPDRARPRPPRRDRRGRRGRHRPARERGMTLGTPTPAWTHRHLLDVDLLTRAEIERVLDLADRMRTARETRQYRSLLDLETVALAFYEPSTRTRVSFELAAKALGATVVD